MSLATAPRAATATRRWLAPRLARGFMLLAIVLSHTPGFDQAASGHHAAGQHH